MCQTLEAEVCDFISGLRKPPGKGIPLVTDWVKARGSDDGRRETSKTFCMQWIGPRVIFIEVVGKHLRVKEVHGVCGQRKGIGTATEARLILIVGRDPGIGQTQGPGLTTTLVS